MKKKTLLIKTADLCIRIHYKYPYIEQQCETWRVNEGYEPDIEVSVTDEEIEKMREACKNIRELAIIELLYSTGIRVGELINLNIKDMNFAERSCIVLGKGNKQREVYYDVRTKLHIEEYLKTRNDDNDALFVSRNKPNQRLTSATIELFIRNLGRALNIEKSHPHRFRRSFASLAIDKGMPIEQVQKLLRSYKN